MKRLTLIAVALVALTAAGAASAFALHTIMLGPGHCTKVRGTKVCARAVKPKTVTVSPTAIGKTVTGNGSQQIAPLTIPKNGVTVRWTAQPDSYGNNIFQVSGNGVIFDNGNSTISGTSFIPAGTYTFSVVASGAWTLSF
jgi:hypothetical protein